MIIENELQRENENCVKKKIIILKKKIIQKLNFNEKIINHKDFIKKII